MLLETIHLIEEEEEDRLAEAAEMFLTSLQKQFTRYFRKVCKFHNQSTIEKSISMGVRNDEIGNQRDYVGNITRGTEFAM